MPLPPGPRAHRERAVIVAAGAPETPPTPTAEVLLMPTVEVVLMPTVEVLR
jgi:hypothetical protein